MLRIALYVVDALPVMLDQHAAADATVATGRGGGMQGHGITPAIYA